MAGGPDWITIASYASLIMSAAVIVIILALAF
jgi:hypothetical protein